ncbi:hypothetical protein BDN71DRAFT_1457491 [Pleurotus eryngii]|uniref:F-box domain-containing protein n=1 Tax=Pleurotus eryngii TaxID=5323 RepID=A0A9P5ZIY6_PLEER|nr:hypothetical protein BDN71DRAFT_1457491 [Pleurotus eryngii]
MAGHSRPQKVVSRWPTLPNEILLTIVNELADDRKMLLVLLLVSLSFNDFALRHIYREISLCPNFPPYKDDIRLKRLLRGIEANPGLRFVKSFAFKITPCFTYNKDDTDIQRILPLLLNVRHLSIEYSPLEGEDYTILPLIPRSANLTRLILHRHLYRPGDFAQLRERHPGLKSIAVTYAHPLADIAVSPSAFPNLRSLQLPVEDILRIGSLPSLVDLSIYGNGDAAARHIEKAFPALRTLSLYLSPAFTRITSLTSGLPKLEYLSCSMDVSDITPISSSYGHGMFALAGSGLKYLQLNTLDHSPDYDDVRLVFDSVKSMVVLDIVLEMEELRFYRDFAEPSVLAQRNNKAWWQWWEQEQEDVERAVLKYKSSRTLIRGHNL